ncbi:MAG: hypothetical protein HYX59_08000 [Elusimicrobia bacterium]|nr:hypothetical protein [Elusimicrobiota bacterium]
MHFKTLALVLGLSASAQAQVIYKLPTTLGNIAPISLPSRPVVPMILPSVDAVIAIPTIKPAITPVVVTIITPASLPVYPAPAIGPARLPGVPSPLPLPTPAALASARRPAPSAIEEPFILNWKLLDDKGGDEAASALVPVNPGPQPLSPAGAADQLLSEIKPGQLFDGRKTSQRELELPFNRYF